MQQVIIKRINLIKSIILFNPLGWSNLQAALQGSELTLHYVFHVIETEEIVLGITACSC